MTHSRSRRDASPLAPAPDRIRTYHRCHGDRYRQTYLDEAAAWREWIGSRDAGDGPGSGASARINRPSGA
ncbi:hypothetical protein GCM10027089_09910 [Nocardia thraciensis]